jgi:hypothetical protein
MLQDMVAEDHIKGIVRKGEGTDIGLYIGQGRI